MVIRESLNPPLSWLELTEETNNYVVPTYDLLKSMGKTHTKLHTTTIYRINLGYVRRCPKKRVVMVRFQTLISLTNLRNK